MASLVVSENLLMTLSKPIAQNIHQIVYKHFKSIQMYSFLCLKNRTK